MPCSAPGGTVFSLISLVVGSMFHTTQWTQFPAGASGSSTINASDLVLSGASSITRGGFTSAPSQVYFEGIESLCLNAELDSLSVPISFASIKMMGGPKKNMNRSTVLIILLYFIPGGSPC